MKPVKLSPARFNTINTRRYITPVLAGYFQWLRHGRICGMQSRRLFLRKGGEKAVCEGTKRRKRQRALNCSLLGASLMSLKSLVSLISPRS